MPGEGVEIQCVLPQPNLSPPRPICPPCPIACSLLPPSTPPSLLAGVTSPCVAAKHFKVPFVAANTNGTSIQLLFNRFNLLLFHFSCYLTTVTGVCLSLYGEHPSQQNSNFTNWAFQIILMREAYSNINKNERFLPKTPITKIILFILNPPHSGDQGSKMQLYCKLKMFLYRDNTIPLIAEISFMTAMSYINSNGCENCLSPEDL